MPTVSNIDNQSTSTADFSKIEAQYKSSTGSAGTQTISAAATSTTTSSTTTSTTEVPTKDHKPSSAASASVGADVDNTSTFYLDVQCFLEGVQVPHSAVSVSYGLGGPPTCTLTIPASSVIRDLPETTKIHVFFKDFLPTSEGVYEWRLLFDGELSSYSYTVTSDGAYIQLNGIHSAAYMYLMQLMSLDVSEFIFNPQPQLIGGATMPILLGQSKVNSSIIKRIIEGKNYSSMADIVFQLMRSILNGVEGSATGKYYNAKLGTTDGGWKLLKRVYGVSSKAAAADPVTYDSQYDADGKIKKDGAISSSSTGTSTDYSYGVNGPSEFSSYNDYLAHGMAKAGSSRYYSNSYFTDDSSSFRGMTSTFTSKYDNLTDDFRAYKNDDSYKFDITNGYRSPTHNASAGGVTASRHTTGEAVDIDVAGWSSADINKLCTLAASRGFYVEDDVKKNGNACVHVGIGG